MREGAAEEGYNENGEQQGQAGQQKKPHLQGVNKSAAQHQGCKRRKNNHNIHRIVIEKLAGNLSEKVIPVDRHML